MEYRYLPALSPGSLSGASDDAGPLHWMDARLSDDLRHRALLASYHLWNGKDVTYRGDGTYVFGDSGGFSIVSAGAVIDPRRVIRWQLRNCTAGVILDIPPFSFGGKSRFTGSAADVWHDSVARTTGNVGLALPFYEEARAEGHPFRWWGVVQGETYPQMSQWFDAVSRVYPFTDEGEGWALAPKPCNELVTVTRFMRIARDRKLRRIHMLQTAKPATVGIMLALAALAGVEFVTHDSASTRINAGNRNVFIPRKDRMDGKYTGAAHRTGWEGVTEFVTTRCSCFSCQLLAAETAVTFARPDAYYLDRITFHNFLATKEVEQNMFREAQRDPMGLIRLLARSAYGAVLREWETSDSVVVKHRRTVSLFDRLRVTREVS